MTRLDTKQKEAIQAMATSQGLPRDERKRQYSALRRAIQSSANPGLLAKYSLCNDSERWGVY